MRNLKIWYKNVPYNNSDKGYQEIVSMYSRKDKIQITLQSMVISEMIEIEGTFCLWGEIYLLHNIEQMTVDFIYI